MSTKEKEMITVSKDELAKMIADAVKEEVSTKAETAPAQESHNAWLDEEVEVELFKDGKDYVDDVCVQVNGHSWVIKRGYRVKVPRFVKLQLDNQQRQLMAAAEYQLAQQKEFKEASTRYNI